MVDINDLKTSYERISNYLVETPILSSDSLNKQFEANIFLKNEVEQLTGSFKIRGEISIETLKNGRDRLVINSIPYQVNKSVLNERIAQLVLSLIHI